MGFEQKAFGKRTEAPLSGVEARVARFKKDFAMYENDGTTGDSKLDALMSDYLAIAAMSGEDPASGDSAALKRELNLILEYYEKTQS